MQLSERLQAVADMVTQKGIVADIGTDHAYIPVYLVQEGKVSGAIAMDINKGPLERAKAHIEEAGLSDKIETRLSDGAKALQPKEADSVVIAGMGGRLMKQILTEGQAVFDSVQELVLQPQSELSMFRKFLKDASYQVVQEEMVLEDGKYYPMMRVVHGENDYESEEEFRYGKLLLEQKHPVLLSYLKKEETALFNITLKLKEGKTRKGKQAREERLLEIEKELECVRCAIDRIEQ